MPAPGLLFLVACAPAEPVVLTAQDAPPAAAASATAAAPGAPRAVAEPTAPLSTASGPIRRLWESLLASGCDLDAARLHNPVSVRIVRNTPYALAGLRFKDVNLRLVFADDGGWYTPTTDQAPALDGAVLACVEKLKAHEERLRVAMPIPEEMAARMTRDHALFVLMRSWESSSARSPYGRPRFEQDGEGTWQMWSTYADCTPDGEFECGGYALRCPSETPCEGIAAG